MASHIVIDARRIRDFGIGTYIRSLVQALGAIDRTTQYTLVSGPADARALEGLPENFRSALYARSDHSALDHAAFPIFLRGLSPDLVHIPLNRVPLLMIKPYVVTIHDMANIFFEQEASSLRMQLRRYRFRRGLVRANRVIAVSEATKRDVENQLGVPSGRITRVYNAPDPGFFNRAGAPGGPEQQLTLERYQINYPFLLYAGNIRKHKNIPRLVEAFAVVRDQLAAHPVYKDLRLVIIGDTISQYPSVRQAVIKSRVENVVRFLGFVPFETLRCFYESAAGFVFPSRYEGFGLPPLEAMLLGCPAVVAPCGALPEVCGDAAIYADPNDEAAWAEAISVLVQGGVTRERAASRGQAHASQFTWRRSGEQLLNVIDALVSRSDGRNQ